MAGKSNTTQGFDAAIDDLEAVMNGTPLVKSTAEAQPDEDDGDGLDDDEEEADAPTFDEEVLQKSFAENPALAVLVAGMDDGFGGLCELLEKSMTGNLSVGEKLAKGLAFSIAKQNETSEAMGEALDLIKSLAGEITSLRTRLDEIGETATAVAGAPQPRRAVTGQGQPLEKSVAGTPAPGATGDKYADSYGVSPRQIGQKLEKAMKQAVEERDTAFQNELMRAASVLDRKKTIPETTWERIKDK